MSFEPVWALGCMSGTSLDGVDAAMLLTDGVEVFDFGPSEYRAHTPDERHTIAAVLGAWPGDPGVDDAAAVVEAAHIEVIGELPHAQIIGFHGQTLAHDPRGMGTHQAGDGARLAQDLGVPVVWDFRTADVAAGGQGAPLAPFYHHALARQMQLDAPVAFLNLGGVGNLTWVNPAFADPAAPGALLAFDTGPANAPINDLMWQRRQEMQDEGGALAAEGEADEHIVADFLEHEYFYDDPPKSLDRDTFFDLLEWVAVLEDADAVATLTAIAAASAARGLRHCPSPPRAVLVTGGGRLNPTLMALLALYMDCPVMPVEDMGLDGDMLEAQAFAFLAVRAFRGLPLSGPSTTGVPDPMPGGQISVPSEDA